MCVLHTRIHSILVYWEFFLFESHWNEWKVHKDTTNVLLEYRAILTLCFISTFKIENPSNFHVDTAFSIFKKHLKLTLFYLRCCLGIISCSAIVPYLLCYLPPSCFCFSLNVVVYELHSFNSMVLLPICLLLLL